MLVNAGFAIWTLPVTISLLLAAPIASSLSFAPSRNSWLWRAMATPEDLRTPAVVSAAQRNASRINWQLTVEQQRVVIPAPAVAAALVASKIGNPNQARV
ncbi:MAG: hypothetical protein EON48_13660 [Acetobacteraceae bacterium]|nr:MAG: hypothetical protein EON48_13660 [Acetobacteraceae bacterium]